MYNQAIQSSDFYYSRSRRQRRPLSPIAQSNGEREPLSPYQLVNLSTIPCLFLIAVILLTSCNTPPAEQYGFLTLLGNDTIAVESVTRQGNTITSDAVDRFPRVRVRHTVIELAPDGSIKHL